MSLTITIASLFNAPRIVPFGVLRTFSGVPVGSATAQATTAAFAVVAIAVAAARDKAAIIRLSMVVFSIRRLISAAAHFGKCCATTFHAFRFLVVSPLRDLLFRAKHLLSWSKWRSLCD